MGTDEYNKKKPNIWDSTEQKKPAKQDIINTKAAILQNAVRNKLARNALLQQKQIKTNEMISQINQQRQAHNKQSLII